MEFLLLFQGSIGNTGLKGYQGDSGEEVMIIKYNFSTDYSLLARYLEIKYIVCFFLYRVRLVYQGRWDPRDLQDHQ